MADFKMEIKGMQELRAAMLSLPSQFDQKLLQSVLMPGAIAVRDEARRLAPVLKIPSKHRLAGVLKRNIRVAKSKPAPGMTATVIIGVRKFSKAQIRKLNKNLNASKKITGKTHVIAINSMVGNPFYWRFMEFGYTDRGGTYHGPHNGGYLRPAFESKVDSSLKLITVGMDKQINKVGKKLGLRTKRDFYG